MREFEKINWLPVSERFNQYLCSNAFEFLKETGVLYFNDVYKVVWSRSSKYEIFCFETKTSFKKHVLWSKTIVLSNINSLEQFADGAKAVKFT